MYKKITFDSFSFGCRVNEAEKIVMDKQMIEAGLIKDPHTPNVYIINTCAITAKAEREARQLIMKLKRNNPLLKLVVTGCSATHWQKNNIWKNIPIDLIISNIDKKYATKLILKRFFEGGSSVPAVAQPLRLNNGLLQQDKFLSSGRVMIKIQDGCHCFCSYCIVPYLRGTSNSRRIHQIISDVKDYEETMKEVVYTAINTESFGKDTGESLINLIDVSIHRTKIARISFGSIHPWSIDDNFIKYYKKISENPRFSNFFHVPIQSGSNKILNLMKREYKIEDVINKLNEIQKINSLALIATDIITGFLEETDKEFEYTYKLLESSPINKFHVFRFSPRQNTAAFYMKNRLKEPTEKEKVERARKLSKLGRIKYAKFLEKHIGLFDNALFIGGVHDGYQRALLNNQISSWIKTNDSLRGSMKHVKITGLQKNNLVGEIA